MPLFLNASNDSSFCVLFQNALRLWNFQKGHKLDKKASVIYDQLQRRQVPDKSLFLFHFQISKSHFSQIVTPQNMPQFQHPHQFYLSWKLLKLKEWNLLWFRSIWQNTTKNHWIFFIIYIELNWTESVAVLVFSAIYFNLKNVSNSKIIFRKSASWMVPVF